jgi:hypothetical protein
MAEASVCDFVCDCVCVYVCVFEDLRVQRVVGALLSRSTFCCGLFVTWSLYGACHSLSLRFVFVWICGFIYVIGPHFFFFCPDSSCALIRRKKNGTMRFH